MLGKTAQFYSLNLSYKRVDRTLASSSLFVPCLSKDNNIFVTHRLENFSLVFH